MSPKTRLLLGITLAVGGNLLFFTSFWIWWMPWSVAVKSTLTGILFFAPEVGTLAGVAIMGKENHRRMQALLRKGIQKIKPRGSIGKKQHFTGLILLLCPLVPWLIQAFWPEWLPDASHWRIWANLTAIILSIGGLFVLGGDFWDKLGALFQREARVAATRESTVNENAVIEPSTMDS